MMELFFSYYCREAGVRNLQKHMEKIFRKVPKCWKGQKQPVKEADVCHFPFAFAASITCFALSLSLSSPLSLSSHTYTHTHTLSFSLSLKKLHANARKIHAPTYGCVW